MNDRQFISHYRRCPSHPTERLMRMLGAQHLWRCPAGDHEESPTRDPAWIDHLAHFGCLKAERAQ